MDVNDQISDVQNKIPDQVVKSPGTHRLKYLTIFLGVIVSLLMVAGVGYYFGTKSVITVSPPTPTLSNNNSATNTPTLTPTDSQTYTSSKYGYSIRFPSNLEISQVDLVNAPKSVIIDRTISDPEASAFPVFYISVVPNDDTNMSSTIYNFIPASVIDSLFLLKDNESKPTQTGTNSRFWTFKKIGVITVSGIPGIIVENDTVWEGSPGLKDRRVFVKNSDLIYMIGTYYKTAQELSTFESFVSDFVFTKK